MIKTLLCIVCLATAIAPDQIRHAQISVTPCDTKQKTSFGLTITERSPSAIDNKNRTSELVIDSKDAGKSTVTIKTDKNGWPVDCKVSGAGADADGISMMLFLLRKPFWSSNSKQTDWFVSILNPFDPHERLRVACHLSHPKPRASAVRVEEKTGLISVIGGMKGQFTSTLECDAIHGKVIAVLIRADVNAKEKNGQLMEYEEKS